MNSKTKWALVILLIIIVLVIIGGVVAFLGFSGDAISEVDCGEGEDCSARIEFDGLEYTAFCEPLPDDVLAGLESFAQGNLSGSDVELFELPGTAIEEGFGAVFTEESPACGGTPSHLFVR